ncbi:speckle-type poz protein [Culex quinquefasciatus]|uniref:Speckle-type poz protein n=1 Tax=Culex quinquefasciatus TaxID=7176 RepID=B0WBI3_CULQU|nr:speckle-type poz protein [Culex quinquefasciatus]|eukprot:XP_001846067.1 speckle-type poz protein [Culex quinquefasciatus]
MTKTKPTKTNLIASDFRCPLCADVTVFYDGMVVDGQNWPKSGTTPFDFDQPTGYKLMYTAADKYDIATLKSLCRRHIMAKLRWKTAADTLVLADMHNDHEMKQETLQFLSGSVAVNVTKTTGWKTMVQTHPHLVKETVWALAAKLPPT